MVLIRKEANRVLRTQMNTWIWGARSLLNLNKEPAESIKQIKILMKEPWGGKVIREEVLRQPCLNTGEGKRHDPKKFKRQDI